MPFYKSLLLNIVLMVNLVMFSWNYAHALKEITVYGNQDRGPVRLFTGWLHGFEQGDAIPVADIELLNSSSWRICKWWMHEQVIQFTQNIQFGVSFTWRWYEYGNPADDLPLWEQYLQYHVLYSLDNNKPIEYWDIWNEPDHEYFWSWSYEDLLLTYKVAHDTIKALDPDAKLIGPSFAKFVARDNFNGKTIADFITDLYIDHGVLLEAVSWHMNDEWYPWNIPGHVTTLTNAIDTIGAGYDPKLGINEYTQSLIVLRPVYLASFVWYMDISGIDFSNIACWNIYSNCSPPSTFSSCWAGIDGLFMNDYSSPQHSYWFYKWHASESGNSRLEVSEPEINTFALASKNDALEEITICVGKHGHQFPVEDVELTVLDFPYDTSEVELTIHHLPAEHEICNDDVWKPLQVPRPHEPDLIDTQVVTVMNGTVSLNLQAFHDWDLYFITMKSHRPLPTLSFWGITLLLVLLFVAFIVNMYLWPSG